MKNSLKKLLKLMPPPEKPVCNLGEWYEIEKQLGTCLPSDYKDFIFHYGSGGISNWLFVDNYIERPDRARKNLTFVSRLIEDVKCEFLNLGRTPPPLFPFPLYPDANGLFPWGGGADGWDFYWLRSGEPEKWGVVATFKHIEEHYSFPERNMTDFLLDLLCNPFDQRLQSDPSFEPATPSSSVE